MEVKGVTFMAERIWRDSHEFSGVFIHKEDEFGGGTTVTARRGTLVVAPRGEASVLVLEDGVRLEAAPPTANRDSPSESGVRSEEHTSELQSLMRISYAGFCLNKKIQKKEE